MHEKIFSQIDYLGSFRNLITDYLGFLENNLTLTPIIKVKG